MNSRQELENLRDTELASGKEITAASLRQFQTAMIASMLNLLDDIKSLTANKGLALDADKTITDSVGTTQLEYLANVTSDLQEQLDAKLFKEDPLIKGKLQHDPLDWDGIEGTSKNDNPAAGCVGEYIESLIPSGGAQPITTNTKAVVANIMLTPGDWDVEGQVNFNEVNVTQVDQREAGITDLPMTLPNDGTEHYDGSANDGTRSTVLSTVKVSRKRISINTPTMIYVNTQATFTAGGGSVAAWGSITARRVR